MQNNMVPNWIIEIIEQIQDEYDIYIPIDKIAFGRSKNYHGFHRPSREIICIFAPSNEKNDKILLVLLHELAHFIQHRLYFETLSRRSSTRKRRVVHNLAFWKIAYSLYRKFNILEFALSNEPYRRGRKELTSLNRSYNSNFQNYWPEELRIPKLKNQKSL